MSFDAEEHSDGDHEQEDDNKAHGTALYEAEAEIENKIKKGKNDREPRISVHHGDSEEIRDPLCLVELPFNDQHQDSVDNDIYIERNDDRPDDPFPDKALKIILLGIETLDQTVSRAEKEDGYEVGTRIYKC